MATAALAVAALFAIAPPARASDVTIDTPDQLEIDGDLDSDAITVSTDGATITIVDSLGVVEGDPFCIAVNATTVACPASVPGEDPIDDLDVDLRTGVDSFTNQNLVTFGGDISSDGDAKTIFGGPGDQFIAGADADDVLDGGPGDDTIADGSQFAGDGGGNDQIIGGDGVDDTFYMRGTTPVSVSIDGIANDGQAGEADNVQVENVSTGEGNDVLTGDASPNRLSGGLGDDRITGLGANDEILGEGDINTGLTIMRGIPGLPGGNDVLDGGAGRDNYSCGAGIDIVFRGLGDDFNRTCERVGAFVVDDSAGLTGKKKNKFEVAVECPDSEVKACAGRLKGTAGGKKVAKGRFSVPPGETKNAKAKLSKKGRKALRRGGGSLLITIDAETALPGGVAEDSGRIFVYR